MNAFFILFSQVLAVEESECQPGMWECGQGKVCKNVNWNAANRCVDEWLCVPMIYGKRGNRCSNDLQCDKGLLCMYNHNWSWFKTCRYPRYYGSAAGAGFEEDRSEADCRRRVIEQVGADDATVEDRRRLPLIADLAGAGVAIAGITTAGLAVDELSNLNPGYGCTPGQWDCGQDQICRNFGWGDQPNWQCAQMVYGQNGNRCSTTMQCDEGLVCRFRNEWSPFKTCRRPPYNYYGNGRRLEQGEKSEDPLTAEAPAFEQ